MALIVTQIQDTQPLSWPYFNFEAHLMTFKISTYHSICPHDIRDFLIYFYRLEQLITYNQKTKFCHYYLINEVMGTTTIDEDCHNIILQFSYKVKGLWMSCASNGMERNFSQRFCQRQVFIQIASIKRGNQWRVFNHKKLCL